MIFLISTSRAQAALFVYLSELKNGLKVTPCESLSSTKIISDLINFYHNCSNTRELESKVRAFNSGKDVPSSVDDYLSTQIDSISSSSYSFAISVSGSKIVGHSIPVAEINACVSFYQHFKTWEGGDFYHRFVPSLKSTQILALIGESSGDVTAHISLHRPLSKLYYKNYGGERDDPFFAPFKLSVLDTIDRHSCVFDPSKIELSILRQDARHLVRLMSKSVKEELSRHASVKNGHRFLDIKSITVYDGGNIPHTITCNTQYQFPTQSKVSPIVDANSMEFYGAITRIRLDGGTYIAEVPVSEHLVLSEPHADFW
jgi:hypothetical protein